jgi:nitrate/TMAO reductase-like tetraheme cytochrome c subunit
MKKPILFAAILIALINFAFSAPRVQIKVEAVTPYTLGISPSLTGDSTISSGTKVIANRTYVYFSVWNFGDTGSISNVSWVFVSRPPGSNATITPMPQLGWWAKFRADTTGTYEIRATVTTSTGTKDTTTKIYSARYVGVGNFANVPAVYPNCMVCHSGMPQFQDIFNRWKVSGHANMFRYNIDSGSSSYGISCMKCHTTGYDRNLYAVNNGFDDVARNLGWNWSNYTPPKPGNWDTLRTFFTPLTQFATIGCENCHGPGSEHALGGGDTNKIVKDYSGNNCAQCHDAPSHHPYYRQWKNAKHSDAIWSSSFAQATNNAAYGTNNNDNCIRCHDGRGYINFTRAVGTATQGMTAADQTKIACASCHDPHGNSNEYYLRNRPAGSDTLAGGYNYSSMLGKGKVCASCHHSRRYNVTYVQTRLTSAFWGPHESPQADVLLGKNAAQFTLPYISGSHKTLVPDGCVTCHMAPADTGTSYMYRVGGHSVTMEFDSINYDHVKGCLTCHPGITHFDDIMAGEDYDSSGTIQSWKAEIAGMVRRLRIALPPVGIDSVSWQLIAADSLQPYYLTEKKAYWNLQLITNDGSGGMHNPLFAVDVLRQSRWALIGVIGIQPISTEIPNRYELTQNYPNPFNPSTRFTFSLPKAGDVTIKVYDITGREVVTLVNEKLAAGKYAVTWDAAQFASGAYIYRIVAGNFVETKKMVVVK